MDGLGTLTWQLTTKVRAVLLQTVTLNLWSLTQLQVLASELDYTI